MAGLTLLCCCRAGAMLCALHRAPGPTRTLHTPTARARWQSAIRAVAASARRARGAHLAAGALASAGGQRASLRSHILTSTPPAARSRHDLQIIDMLQQQCDALALLSRRDAACLGTRRERGWRERAGAQRVHRGCAATSSSSPTQPRHAHRVARMHANTARPQGRAPRARAPRAAADLRGGRRAVPRGRARRPSDRHHHGAGACPLHAKAGRIRTPS